MKIVVKNLSSQSNEMLEDKLILENKIKELQEEISNLSRVWRGDDATSFASFYQNQVLPLLRKYVDAFGEFQQFLSEVPNVFDALDESYSGKISI